ncbi:tit1 [[Candida] subhashii]|uniref:tRNA dimethylallyltransferase n=1 Tax=[Candida] subhashii TaxID=561895 RepID=A0A8J5UIF0_9ASCO|nr:tit1 [[Candida] subhashii]KAG7663573.1 tit1 [[Candida] subhashii]
MTIPKKPIISIVGTTGVGKSQFSIDLAEAINGEIINADSMQVYKKLDTITNKHPLDERHGIPHYVMDHVDWNEDYYIHRFSKEANAAIDDIHARGKIPIVIGGTHYYLQNLLFKNKTVGEMKIENKELTKEQLEVLDGPVDVLFEQLKSVDPVIASKFHPQDQRKLRRAMEIWYKSGEKPSQLYHDQKLDEIEESSLKYNTLFFWVYCDRDVLIPRLDERVDKMIESGAIEEINELYEVYESQDPHPDCTSGIWQVIGFKEFLPWLTTNKKDDKLLKEGIERMKIRTRQYAKYQIKWIKKLLSAELQKESRFNFKYGGKLYLLDATDLSTWQDNVAKIGIHITKQFLLDGPTKVTYPQAPESLMHIIPFDESSFTKSQKILGAEANWKHYTCDVCKDKSGAKVVAVGEDAWNIHVQSRRHSKNLHYSIGRKRRSEYENENNKKSKE